MPVHVHLARDADLTELAAVAAAAFPLACPPSAPASEVAAFIAANLTEQHFARYLDDADRAVFVASDERILGYSMLVRGEPTDTDVLRAVALQPTIELSKIYVLPQAHGSGVAAALMTTTLAHAASWGARCMWLGVNQENQRAQHFYAKHGFTVSGTKTFQLGSRVEHDYVLVRPLP